MSLALITLEQNTRLLEGLRSQLNAVVSPLRVVADTPYLVGRELDGFFASHSRLRRRNEDLRMELLKLGQISQQFATLRAENVELRELLGSRRRVAHDVLVAEVIGLVPAPNRHEIVIDKGSNADVQAGQAVIDAEGLIGQVIETDALTARVMLLADSLHAVPVVANRNGVRGIVNGT
ncbi:MAG: rod shape-determining protein MreC, partial [Pseudomonadota bacterium]